MFFINCPGIASKKGNIIRRGSLQCALTHYLRLYPHCGIVNNVFAAVIKVEIVADDMFIEISLPETDAGGIAKNIDLFGCC